MSLVEAAPAASDSRAAATRIRHYRAGGVSLVLETGLGLPRVLHWGAELPQLDAAELESLALASIPPVVSNTPDEAVRPSLLPEQSAGWLGSGGLFGHRSGARFSTAFDVDEYREECPGGGIAHRVTVLASDPVAALGLSLVIELSDGGLLRARASVTNSGTDDYTVDALSPVLPVPSEATEILDLTGRHLRERSPQRHGFTVGTHLRESKRGRTGHDATLLLAAGAAGFGFRAGQVWAVHVAWSGNHRTFAEHVPFGDALLGGGELLLPGEVILAPGESYDSPWLYGSYGEGLDAVSARFHRYLRSRPTHPSSPRPVLLNVWEAVYFDHDLDTLKELAGLAASVGVERYVLDDGWFRNRRDDHAGLGDWYVDETVWPDGLGPLIEHVKALGMQFGLWFEPEMVNPDSDLARAHPDWIMAAGDRQPVLSRHQQVLNLTIPEAFEHILGRIDAILGEYDIDFIKWDHNRDLIEGATRASGRGAVHGQTLAFYRMLDELKRRHPGLEIESCASGGGRADLEALEHSDRIWASDTIDALERQQIQRYTTLLLPPELMGAHIGAERAHTTHRRHDLAFRAGTALFGHLGIEWNLAEASEEQRAELAAWIAEHKRLRELLHSGDVIRGDHPDAALWVHGVAAADRSAAVFALTAVATGVTTPPGRVRLPGLDPDAKYRVAPLEIARQGRLGYSRPVPWNEREIVLSGRTLAEIGVQAPALYPEQLTLLSVDRI